MSLHDELVTCIIATRDFCGDERAACLDVFADNGMTFDSGKYGAALFEANNRWRNFQKQAGVPDKRLLW